MDTDSLIVAMYQAIGKNDVVRIRELVRDHPQIISYNDKIGGWMHAAASDGHLDVIRCLAELGLDVNLEAANSSRDTPLFCALAEDNPKAVELLLTLGANPNHDGEVITAIVGDKQRSLQLVKLLESYGADIHAVFPFADGSNINALSMARAYGKDDVVEYLLSKGAVMPDQPPPKPKRPPETQEEQIVAYFEREFGPVLPESLIEIVPTDPPIAVHVIPADGGRDRVTLFTTGMSDLPMTVPDGHEEFQFAELFIELPPDWKYRDVGDPRHGWPIHWLRRIAQYPHQEHTHLGAVLSVFDVEDPPRPVAPGLKFVSMLLYGAKRMTTSKGREITLYRLMPLYPEERALALEQDIFALLRAFDRFDMSDVVDLWRPNAVTDTPPTKR